MYMYLPSMPHTTKLGDILNADKSCVLRIRTTAEEHPLYLRDEGDMPRLEDRLDLYFQSRLHEPYRINPQRQADLGSGFDDRSAQIFWVQRR